MMREVQAERERVRRRRESTEDRTRVRVNYARATFESTVCVRLEKLSKLKLSADTKLYLFR